MEEQHDFGVHWPVEATASKQPRARYLAAKPLTRKCDRAGYRACSGALRAIIGPQHKDERHSRRTGPMQAEYPPSARKSRMSAE